MNACPYCKRPEQADGSIVHAYPCAGLDRVDINRLQYDALVAAARAAGETPCRMPAESAVLAWAVRSFGPIAENVDERAARVAEEAIEIAQVEGVPLETITRIADRVYSRPAGERWQEIGGTMLGLLSYAAIVGLTLSDCARREFDRVLAKPRDWWAKKHAEKVAAGTADLSPVKASVPNSAPLGTLPEEPPSLGSSGGADPFSDLPVETT